MIEQRDTMKKSDHDVTVDLVNF